MQNGLLAKINFTKILTEKKHSINQLEVIFDKKINLMKSIKTLFLLFFSITLINCSDDNATPAYLLSYENIAGTYNVQNLSVSTDITTSSNGFDIKVGSASLTGDTFQIDLVMNVNGTYSAKGAYRTLYKLTPVAGNGFEETKIINIDNSGNYTLNTTTNKITFSGDLLKDLKGSLNINTFNETSFSLFQEIDVPVNSNVEKVTTNIAFVRK